MLTIQKHVLQLIVHFRTQSSTVTSLQPVHTQNLSFRDDDLQKAYENCFHGSLCGDEIEDHNRPRKKIRLSISKELGSKKDIRSYFLKSLYHVLESQEANGSSLDQIAM